MAPDGSLPTEGRRPDPIRALSPGMYEDGRAYERTTKWGNAGLDEMQRSGNFKSGTVRFVYPRAPIEEENTYNTLHSGYYQDQYARLNRTWTAPIGTDSQRAKSPGPGQYHEKRFQKKSLHVRNDQTGFLAAPSPAPGYLYDPSIPSRPSIDRAAKDKTVYGHKTSFKSVTERFSYQKNHSPVKEWKFYDTGSAVPTISHAAGSNSRFGGKRNGAASARARSRGTTVVDKLGIGGGPVVHARPSTSGGSSQFASGVKRFVQAKPLNADHTSMPLPYSSRY